MCPHQVVVDRLQEHFNLRDCDLVLRPEWASTRQHYRQQIRNHIFENIESSGSILKLDQRPVIKGRGISISHNKVCGGFFTTTDHEMIGFDIEMNHRLNQLNMQRFSANKKEMSETPSAAALWTAKEAAFKSLQDKDQPNVIKEIEIGDWNKINAALFSCRVIKIKTKITMSTRGLVFNFEDRTMAFFMTGRI